MAIKNNINSGTSNKGAEILHQGAASGEEDLLRHERW